MQNNKQPIISICIPTYNRRYSLQYTLKSIMDQDEFKSWDVEIAISDNASTDETEDEIKKLCQKHKNIRYSRNKKNVWMNSNINKAILLWKWKYLRCLSSHAIPLPWILSNIKAILQKNYCDILILAWNAVDYNIYKSEYYDYTLEISKFPNKNEFFNYVWQQIKFDKSSFRDLTDCFSNMSYEIINYYYYRKQLHTIIEERGLNFINDYNFTHWFIAYYKSEKEWSVILSYKKSYKWISDFWINNTINERKTWWFHWNPVYFKDACYLTRYLSKEYKLNKETKKFLAAHRLFWLKIFILGLIPNFLKNLFSDNLKNFIINRIIRL